MHTIETVSPVARPVTPSGIILSKLERLQTLAQELGYLDQSFTQTLGDAVALAGGLEHYLTICSTAESGALAQLSQATRSEDWAGRFDDGGTTLPLEQEMLSGHLEGQFLKILIRATGARRVLEIGVFSGYSALAMAEALPEEGRLVALEIDPFAAAFAQRCFARSPHGHKITVQVGPAIDTLGQLVAAGDQFDFVFIDADKIGYWAYLDTLLSHQMVTADTLICVDNTLMQGQPYGAGELTANGQAVAEFNARVAADPRVEQVLLPVRDGVTLIRIV